MEEGVQWDPLDFPDGRALKLFEEMGLGFRV